MRVCVCACVRACVRTCIRACMCECVRACVCAHAYKFSWKYTNVCFFVIVAGVSCGEAPTIDNVRSESTGLKYMDNATYTCKTGFRREGPHGMLVCSEHAKWEGDVITCTGKPLRAFE